MKTIEIKIIVRTNDAAVPSALATFIEQELNMLKDLDTDIQSITAREQYRVPHADHCAVSDKEHCTCGAEESNQ